MCAYLNVSICLRYGIPKPITCASVPLQSEGDKWGNHWGFWGEGASGRESCLGLRLLGEIQNWRWGTVSVGHATNLTFMLLRIACDTDTGTATHAGPPNGYRYRYKDTEHRYKIYSTHMLVCSKSPRQLCNYNRYKNPTRHLMRLCWWWWFSAEDRNDDDADRVWQYTEGKKAGGRTCPCLCLCPCPPAEMDPENNNKLFAG